jgi:hypothetical protein
LVEVKAGQLADLAVVAADPHGRVVGRDGVVADGLAVVVVHLVELRQ